MDLHELLDAATADLPDAPDLLPRVQRIHHRRTMLTRGGMLTAAVALAVGAGTLTTAAPWHHSGAAPALATVATGGGSTAGIDRFPVGQREAAPHLSGTTLTGKTYAASYGGHVTVINMWGSWCTACRQEAPSFAETAQRYTDKGVQFLGIDTMDNDTGAKAYESQFGIDYPSLTDPEHALILLFKPVIPADAVPATVIVDKDGEVAVVALGKMTKAELDAEIAYAST
jgi:thiol-disulfide isomerase/thioredoxin